MEAVSLGSWTLLHARVHVRVQHSTRYFPADGSTNLDVFFGLEPFASQGESSLKISAYQV